MSALLRAPSPLALQALSQSLAPSALAGARLLADPRHPSPSLLASCLVFRLLGLALAQHQAGGGKRSAVRVERVCGLHRHRRRQRGHRAPVCAHAADGLRPSPSTSCCPQPSASDLLLPSLPSPLRLPSRAHRAGLSLCLFGRAFCSHSPACRTLPSARGGREGGRAREREILEWGGLTEWWRAFVSELALHLAARFYSEPPSLSRPENLGVSLAVGLFLCLGFSACRCVCVCVLEGCVGVGLLAPVRAVHYSQMLAAQLCRRMCDGALVHRGWAG